MNITRGNRTHAEAEPTDGVGGGTLGRRSVLGGLAAIPVLTGLVGSAIPASAAAAAQRGSIPAAAGDLALGVERRYNAPLLAAGTRLVLPAGVKAVPVQDYYHRPRLALTASAWPHVRAADGTTVDASAIPEPGAPTRIAMLSGFTIRKKVAWSSKPASVAGSPLGAFLSSESLLPERWKVRGNDAPLCFHSPVISERSAFILPW